MFALHKSKIDHRLYQMGHMDTASNGHLGNMLTNIQEAGSFLDPFEIVFPKATEVLKNFGHEFEQDVAEQYCKPLWQCLRHGLAIDWTVNYAQSLLEKKYPFSKHEEFTHTQDFIDAHANDPVFADALNEIAERANALFDWVFEDYPDRDVFAKLQKWADTYNLADAMHLLEVKPVIEPFVFPEAQENISRVKYLILLMEMLSQEVGYIKRTFWHDLFDKITSGESDLLIVSGSRYRVYVYGDMGNGVKWQVFNDGIKQLGVSGRMQRSDAFRAFPDQMTFFLFTENALYLDETRFPRVSFDEGETWLNPNEFSNHNPAADHNKPMSLWVRYDLECAPGATVKVVGRPGVVVKDATIVLDEDGIGRTQLAIQGSAISFKVSDVNKVLPFGVYATTNTSSAENFPWLENK